MASSPNFFTTALHARSISLPSTAHPTVPVYDDILCRLKSSDSASSSYSSMRNNLEGLQDLYNCVDSLMLLSETRQALARECSGQWVEKVLDGSLRLLDVCGTAKDSLSIMKECVQELQSSLRRKGCDSKEACKYLTCRKNVKKSIQKALRNSDFLKTKTKDHGSLFMASVLKEVEHVTLVVLESLLSFVYGPRNQSLVSKMMLSKSSKRLPNEVEQMDVEMQSIINHKAVGMNSIQTDVADLQLSIEDLESGVDCLYRHLIKIRVTLLNTVSN